MENLFVHPDVLEEQFSKSPFLNKNDPCNFVLV